MKTRLLAWISWITFLVSVAFFATNAPAALTTNSWTDSLPGNWHDPFSWSAGVPSNNQTLVRIVNSGSKVVLISVAVPGTMTISNLLLSAATGATNTLALTDPGTNVPLRILNTLTITSGGSLAISNGEVRVDGSTVNPLKIDGEVLLDSVSSRLTVTNGNGLEDILLGYASQGSLTVSNGSLLSGYVSLGNEPGTKGIMRVAGGTNRIDRLVVGSAATSNGNGELWVTGGQLSVNTPVTPSWVGAWGNGTVTVSNGTFLVHNVDVGAGPGVGGGAGAGTLSVAGGQTICTVGLTIGAGQNSTGTVWITGGQLLTTNTGQFTYIGVNGAGRLTMSNGTWLAWQIQMGNGPDPTSPSSMTIAGGTNVVTSILSVGYASNNTAAVWLTGGRLVATNATTLIGADGTGQITISNGIFLAGAVHLGANTTASGTLTAGSTITALSGPLIVGGAGTGVVWVTGGQLVVTNTPSTVGAGSGFIVDGLVTLTNGSSIIVSNVSTIIGNAGSGSLTNFGGSLLVTNLIVGNLGGSVGNLILTGGTNTVTGNLLVGNFACSSAGNVVVSGGRLSVTNAAHTAVLEVRSGTLLQNSGTLVIDKLVITNSCGHFNKTGGTLSITSTNLAAGLDADGDGLPNDWEQSHGLSPFDNTGNNGASGDPDGDGFSNLQEYLGGSDPHSAASVPDAIWISGSSGKWEVGGNWLIAVPPTNNQSVFITNASPKTVTIDAATPTNTMSINNLTLKAGNTLQITNIATATPLHISNNASITANCILSLKNAAASVGTLFIDPFGSLFVTNGSVSTFSQQVQGEVSLVDSIVTNQPGGDINVASILTAELWMSGGSLVCDFSSVNIGGGGLDPGTTFGRMTVSNGYARVNQLYIGYGTGDPASGTLTCAGGTTEATTILWIGTGLGSTGTVWLTGGELAATNVNVTTTMIGVGQGRGQMTVSNGTAWVQRLAVGDSFSSGTITINGGTVFATNVTLGTINCTGTGTVIVAGGSLFVTNAAVAATLNVFSGAVNLNSGTLIVDRLVITNGCGHFVKTGGTLIQNNPPVLGAGLDADGDGLPNDWEQAHGLDPLDPTGNNSATGDPDGDGFTNLQEFQGGTDPQNPSSTPFRITSIVQQGTNVLLTWTTPAGTTNQVQATNGSGGNFATNGFANLSGQMFIGGSGVVTTNYTDTNGATNTPSRYYRVRLVP